MRNRFDRQMESLNSQLTHMGELCEVAISRAAMALRNGDSNQAMNVVEADQETDHMEKDIERLCLRLLLQQQPVARDLRQISAALKMITDMERIGDQASDIAEIIISAGMNETNEIPEIDKMASAVLKMVHDSVASYVQRDLELAREVIEQDDAVDELFETVKKKLMRLISAGDEDGSTAIDLIMVSKYLERIGDHATNIAEWVEFSITGVHKESHI